MLNAFVERGQDLPRQTDFPSLEHDSDDLSHSSHLTPSCCAMSCARRFAAPSPTSRLDSNAHRRLERLPQPCPPTRREQGRSLEDEIAFARIGSLAETRGVSARGFVQEPKEWRTKGGREEASRFASTPLSTTPSIAPMTLVYTNGSQMGPAAFGPQGSAPSRRTSRTSLVFVILLVKIGLSHAIKPFMALITMRAGAICMARRDAVDS